MWDVLLSRADPWGWFFHASLGILAPRLLHKCSEASWESKWEEPTCPRCLPPFVAPQLSVHLAGCRLGLGRPRVHPPLPTTQAPQTAATRLPAGGPRNLDLLSLPLCFLFREAARMILLKVSCHSPDYAFNFLPPEWKTKFHQRPQGPEPSSFSLALMLPENAGLGWVTRATQASAERLSPGPHAQGPGPVLCPRATSSSTTLSVRPPPACLPDTGSHHTLPLLTSPIRPTVLLVGGTLLPHLYSEHEQGPQGPALHRGRASPLQGHSLFSPSRVFRSCPFVNVPPGYFITFVAIVNEVFSPVYFLTSYWCHRGHSWWSYI